MDALIMGVGQSPRVFPSHWIPTKWTEQLATWCALYSRKSMFNQQTSLFCFHPPTTTIYWVMAKYAKLQVPGWTLDTEDKEEFPTQFRKQSFCVLLHVLAEQFCLLGQSICNFIRVPLPLDGGVFHWINTVLGGPPLHNLELYFKELHVFDQSEWVYVRHSVSRLNYLHAVIICVE